MPSVNLMSKFASMDCIPCRIGAPTLSRQEIDSYLPEVKGWKYEPEPDKIIKEYTFKDFSEALEFVNQVGRIAEKEGHHPNLYLHSYNKVKIELWTHKINGLHLNDFIMATKINRI